MSDTCGCCTGLAGQTPAAIANPPGLSALAYRVGTHATLFARMVGRLSSKDYPALADLRTRERSDPAIALLDAWATVADVLTFYQERISNEGYLRTATERHSILELARLVGYDLRPGVAASTFLAYTLEKDHETEIPAGSRVQSVPGPGELPQTFETAEPLKARAAWNNLQPRMTRPQRITLGDSKHPLTDANLIEIAYFEGTATKLQPNDALLFVFSDKKDQQVVRLVTKVEPDFDAKRTAVTLQEVSSQEEADFLATLATDVAAALRDEALQQPTKQPAIRLVTMLKALQASMDAGVPVAQVAKEVKTDADQLLKIGARPAIPKALKALIVSLQSDLIAALGKLVSTEALVGGSPTTGPVDGLQQDARSKKTDLSSLVSRLGTPHSMTPANGSQLFRNIADTFAANADTAPKLLVAFRPELAPLLYAAMANASVTDAPGCKVYALRVNAPLFGHNATPNQVTITARETVTKPWPIIEDTTVVTLDTVYPGVFSGSWVIVQEQDTPLVTQKGSVIAKAGSDTASLSVAKYGISGKCTKINLVSPLDGRTPVPWFTRPTEPPPVGAKGPGAAGDEAPMDASSFDGIRSTRVCAQSEELALAKEPITCSICDHEIELDSLYDGLETGRWIIVAGERADIPGVTGVKDAELAMLAGVSQTFDETLPGDRLHTKLTLANDGLAFCFKRDTAKIYGNVVRATHGETRNELLGSGDGAVPRQRFDLKASPLTFVAAATATGAASTLNVRANDVLWHEVEAIADAGPTGHAYVTRTDDTDKTTTVFGDGIHGARLPTGSGNVKAAYRSGIGKPGNVQAGQLTLLATKPLGVKEVVNPIRASGGADRDNRDQARRNVPVALQALDRLVSVQDYADFARSFAGIGKASARRLSDGHRELVHVTIAGVDDIPIDQSSDLHRTLLAALQGLGDPFQPVQLAPRSLLLLVMSAGVALQPDYAWELVEPKIRAAVLEAFGFDHRELGQSVYLSEVASAIQAVEGVAYVDVDKFGSVPEDIDVDTLLGGLATTLGRADYVAATLAATGVAPGDPIAPAQLAIFASAVPETLLLNEVTP